MVDSMANLLLETLRDVLVEEVKFLSGVSDEVKKVERDLRTIHGLLMDADRKRSDSPALRNCIISLKELAMKAENVLETYTVEVKSKREGKSLKQKLQRLIGIFCECAAVHQTGIEIDGIRSRLAALTTTLQSLGGGEASSDAAREEQQRFLRLRYAHEIEQHFVGMEKDIQGVVSMVQDDLRPVISICGMGGLGKTTLARKVYHHEDVQGRFDGRAWVCVTQQFQEETILRDIFKQLDSNRGGIDTMVYPRELVRELHNFLEQKKCLIVIDDIWEATHFATLKIAFPMNCKVLLTTRTQKITSRECDDYKLDFLSEDEGWELIRKIAFPTNVEVTDAAVMLENKSKPFEEMGRQIVQKCGCLPLAISVIGGILRQKQQSLTEWEKVSTHIDSYLKRGEGMQIDKRVEHILDLSYDVLPYYLKPCFLYLACFPEDHEIKKEKLYLLWIAEGLISFDEKGNNDSLKDVAERYLTELAHRCMVQVRKSEFDDSNEEFTTCKLHDLMRDLCSSKADEERFMKCVDFSQHHRDISLSIGSSFHRLGIYLVRGDDLQSKSFLQEFEVLRVVLVLCKYSNTKILNIGNIVNFESSKKLRILVFEGVMFEDGKLPSTIGRLIHLRYLSLSGSNVDELPQHVCELPYLHTLDLRVWYECTIKLPNLIWKMKRLRHLFLSYKLQVIGGDKLRLDGLNELETLDEINSETASIVDITNMTNLRELDVSIIQDVDILSKIVEYMSSNRCLLRSCSLTIADCDLSGVEGRDIVKKMLMTRSLSCLHVSNCELQGSIPCYERGMCRNLTELMLRDSKFGGDVHVMEEMGKYPVLTYLWIRGEGHDEVSETEMRFGANSFQQLKWLEIYGLLNIKKWEVEKGALPKLVEFYISDCFRNLEKLPDGLRFIPTLQELYFFGASEELKGRMGKGGENGEGVDYAKFSHIPDIYIV